VGPHSTSLLVARGTAVALSSFLLVAPPLLQTLVGGDTRACLLATAALAIVSALLVWSWPHAPLSIPSRQNHRPRIWPTVAVAVVAAALVAVTCRSWLRQIFTIPIDPFRADMLVVVREGLKRAGQGLNPYVVYHVPWEAPLPYGPMLWGPYALAMLMRADLRFLGVAGALFVPVSCGLAAVASAMSGRAAAAAAALMLLAAIGFNGAIEQFAAIGHTPVYWPLLALFAWLACRRRWRAAAVSLGLLLAARSTLVAIVPVLLMAVWTERRRDAVLALVLVVLAGGLPFLPFAILDPAALAYALYGSYEKVIKEVVWPDPTVPHTIGLTGALLTLHLQAWVERVQILVMSLVYAGCWFGLRRGRSPVALMGVALLAFSMTTLWPVTYIYFDVLLLLAAGVLADLPWLASRVSTAALVRGWTAAAATTAAIVVVMAWWMLPAGEVTAGAVTWRDAPAVVGTALIPRRSLSGAVIDVETGRPPVPAMQVTARLNGIEIGSAGIAGEGGHLTLVAPAGAWQLGVNTLEMIAAAPLPLGPVRMRPLR